MKRTRTNSSEPSRFRSTVWSQIQRAAAGDGKARDQTYWCYRRPVELFLAKQRRGIDAKGIADEVMAQILAPAFLADADRAKGRFRNLLLAVSLHCLLNEVRKGNAKKRGGGRRGVTLEELATDPAASDAERCDFDLFYAKHVMEEAMERFRTDCAARGSPEADVLDLHYWQGLTETEIAERLGIAATAVNNHRHRGGQRFREHLRDVLRPVCSTEEEVKEEVKFLLACLGRSKASPGR